jgi:histidine triad (HIT) family protein
VTSDEKRDIVLLLVVLTRSLSRSVTYLMDCLFCRILAGEIPADAVYEDDRSIAFRDINPQAPQHILVIPREHIESLDEATQKDEALLGHLLRVAARTANEQGLSESGYRTVINTGTGAGQSVLHLHVHVLGGRSLSWPPG